MAMPGSTRPCAARGAHADAAHGFDAAADGDVLHARHHLRGGEIDRVEARGAEAVDLHARHLLAEACLQRRGARDVAACLADRVDAAEHHVLDQYRIEIVAPADRIERRHGEIDRRHLVQRPVRLAASARCANGVDRYRLQPWRSSQGDLVQPRIESGRDRRCRIGRCTVPIWHGRHFVIVRTFPSASPSSSRRPS